MGFLHFSQRRSRLPGVSRFGFAQLCSRPGYCLRCFGPLGRCCHCLCLVSSASLFPGRDAFLTLLPPSALRSARLPPPPSPRLPSPQSPLPPSLCRLPSRPPPSHPCEFSALNPSRSSTSIDRLFFNSQFCRLRLRGIRRSGFSSSSFAGFRLLRGFHRLCLPGFRCFGFPGFCCCGLKFVRSPLVASLLFFLSLADLPSLHLSCLAPSPPTPFPRPTFRLRRCSWPKELTDEPSPEL